MYEGIIATKVPTVHPIPNLNIINMIISVYMVVIVKIIANMHAAYKSWRALYILMRKLQKIVPHRAPIGDIVDKNAFVTTTSPWKLNSLSNYFVVTELTMADINALLKPKKKKHDVTIITTLVCMPRFLSILTFVSVGSF